MSQAIRNFLFAAAMTFVLLILILSIIFQPKGPEVVTTLITLEHIEVGYPLLKLNITMGIHVYVKNRSNAGFRYRDSIAKVYYHGVPVGEAPFESGVVPGRATRLLNTSVDIVANKIVSSPFLVDEISSGSLSFTALSKVDGKGVVLVVSLHATIFISCDVTVFILSRSLTSSCSSLVKV